MSVDIFDPDEPFEAPLSYPLCYPDKELLAAIYGERDADTPPATTCRASTTTPCDCVPAPGAGPPRAVLGHRVPRRTPQAGELNYHGLHHGGCTISNRIPRS